MTGSLLPAIGRMIQSTAVAAASAIGVALVVIPWYSVVAQPSDANAPGISDRGKEQVEGEADAIRPFRVDIPQAALDDLRTRLRATRWPDKETVADQSQGPQLATLQELVHYWGTGYDWRKAEARLNALPQFMTRIDGVDIHFIHVLSRHPNALPLIITHGWPGSVFEQIKLIGPLTDPTQYGGRAEDAFHVVIPSLPGFGFSERPIEAGWGLGRIGSAWAVLMERLGYARYVAQGGDWGAGVVQAMGRQAPAGLLGIHSNLPAVITPEVGAALGGDPSALAAFSVAITVFPDEVVRAQEAWARRAFRNLIYFNEADRGGHFAMWEHPEQFAAELRAAFRSLR